MKILINTSTLVHGGALQVAVSFINELLIDNQEVDYSVICSKQIEKELKNIHKKLPSNFYYLDETPAKLKSRKKTIQELEKIEQRVAPDIVFTVFGPSYWTPKSLHICGFADGWCYYPESIAFTKLSLIQKIKMNLLIKYKLFYLKRSSDFIIVETEDAQKRLSKILKLNLNKIFVVGNSYNRLIYENTSYLNNPVDARINKENINVLTVSAYYPHKNLEIINRAAKLLPEHSNIRFVLTIKDEDYKNYFDSTSKIINLGPLSVFDCPSVYKNCDIVLMPSLLETFSANYPEAMIMAKPIITTDLPFATEVCGSAAIFYDADNEISLVDKLNQLICSKELQNNLVESGLKKVKEFTASDQRAKEYLKIFESIANIAKVVD